MKIALNTYSFRKELEKTEKTPSNNPQGKKFTLKKAFHFGKRLLLSLGSKIDIHPMTLEDVFRVAKNLKVIEGIELLDRHIPGWPDGDLNKGVAEAVELAKKYGLPIIALGPHIKLHRETQAGIDKEIIEIKRWIDLAADNGISNVRTQIGGPWGKNYEEDFSELMRIACVIVDGFIDYADERNVTIGMETHHRSSSHPPFMKELSERYKEHSGLGINFDWGNFKTNKDRYDMLEIAAQPSNHAHNHVKMFRFDENFQEKKYSPTKIIEAYRKNNFTNYFSIEWEGRLPTLTGVYQSAYGLKYAISGGTAKVDPNFDVQTLLE